MRTRIGVLGAAVLLPACAKSPPPPPPGPVAMTDTLVVVDTVLVERAAIDTGADDREAEFRLRLLERNALIQDLQAQLRGEQQEVVRNMAKLQSQASRAEAASEMAEAEIAVRSLVQETAGSESQEYHEGSTLLTQSSTAFGEGNFGGAVYLATKARALATRGRARLRSAKGGDAAEGASAFSIPVPLRTVTRSNVRDGPSTAHGVQFVLEANAPLNGLSYTNQWVYVVSAAGQGGWIFHTLVESR